VKALEVSNIKLTMQINQTMTNTVNEKKAAAAKQIKLSNCQI